MVPPIGSAFPEEIRISLAQENFSIGAVLKFFCRIANKEKRFIYLGTKYDQKSVAFVHINTSVNENFFPTSELKAEHILLVKDNTRLYIDWDCYINCTQLIIRDRDELFNLLVSNPDIHLGKISDDDLRIIREKIKNSRLLKPALKKDYGLFL